MGAERLGLFEELIPPPGGAERFARRLDELAAAPAAGRLRVQVFGAAACLALTLLAAGAWLRELERSPTELVAITPPIINLYGSPEFDRLLGRPQTVAELTIVVGTETVAVTQLETANEKVRIYRIN